MTILPKFVRLYLWFCRDQGRISSWAVNNDLCFLAQSLRMTGKVLEYRTQVNCGRFFHGAFNLFFFFFFLQVKYKNHNDMRVSNETIFIIGGAESLLYISCLEQTVQFPSNQPWNLLKLSSTLAFLCIWANFIAFPSLISHFPHLSLFFVLIASFSLTHLQDALNSEDTVLNFSHWNCSSPTMVEM